MKNVAFLLISLLFTVGANSQTKPFYETYDWEANPTYNAPDLGDAPMIALDHKAVSEFYFTDDEAFVEYFLEHETLVLNADDKIEEFNKLYLPFSASTEILVNKARVITKDNKIIEVDPSKVFEATDEETGRQYQYFALEGIEKGSIVERMYVYKRYPQYNGKRHTLQASYDKKKTSFELYSPSNLEFTFKSFNGLPEIKKDTLTQDKLHWEVAIKDSKALEEEATSAYWANTQFIVYKLDKNLSNGKSGITAYADVVKRLYGKYYAPLSKKENKQLSKFIKEAVGNETNPQEKIRKLDNFIKNNVFQTGGGDDKYEELSSVLDTKVANETGVVRLFTAALTAMEIENELVLTCDRGDIKFDKEFESFNYLQTFLLYFPEYETYTAPSEYDSRYAFPPPMLTDTYGLFIKEVAVGDFKSGVGTIEYIEAPTAEESKDIMLLDIKFDDNDITKTLVTLDMALEGYYAMYIQPYMGLADKENKDKLMDSFAQRLSENIDITNKKMIHGEGALFGVKPMQMVVDFESNTFVEKAGNKYLFKLGELIGKQQELYQEKERVLPVESEFNRMYERTLKVTIPDGYTIANLDDININNTFALEGGDDIFSFVSYYNLEGNQLTITADEFYKQNIVPASAYEGYRTVINSAADFNKVTLVLQKI